MNPWISNKRQVLPILTILLASVIFITSQSNFAFADHTFLGRPVEHASTSFEGFVIEYRNYGVKITQIQADTDNKKLLFDVYTTATPAFLEINLPRNLLDAKSGDMDEGFVVTYQGEVADFDEIKTTETHRTLLIQSMHTRLPDFISEHQEVEIIGTNIFGQTNNHDTAPIHDTDSDGIEDSVDQCDNQAETMNGYQDTDGCPDVIPVKDTDSDGISDSLDTCPTQQETVNGFEDTDGCPDTTPFTNTEPIPKENGIWGKITNLYQKRYPYYDQLHIDVASSFIRDKLCEKTFGEDGKKYYDPCFATDLNGKTIGVGSGILNKIPYQKLRVELYTDNYAQLLDTQYFIWKGFAGEPSPQPEVTPQPKATQPKPNTSPNSCTEFSKHNLIGDQQIVVFTDKESYIDGDTILICGEVRDFLSGTPVMIQVFAANGNLVTLESLDVGPDHKFSTEVSAGGGLWKSKGTYTVKALYGTQARTAETTFEFGGSYSNYPRPVSDPQPVSDNKITICHTPPGNPSNAHTLSISSSALSAHLEHGDRRGECQEETKHNPPPNSPIIQPTQPKSSDNNIRITHNQGDGDTFSGERVTIYGNGATPEGILIINVIAPNMDIIQSFRLTAEGDGDFQTLWIVPKLESGFYTLQVIDEYDIAETKILYKNPNDKGLESEKFSPNDSLVAQKPQPISFWSDKSNYADGSIIRIDGKIKDVQANSFVNIRVYSPSNFNIADERLAVPNNGKFAIDFDTSDKLWFENGEYVIKVEDQKKNLINQIRVTVDEPKGEFLASAQEAPIIPKEKSDNGNDKLSDLIEENKKLREELERQGSEIDNLNKQVDYLSEIINSLKGFFGSFFS